uniref:Transcriptional regulator n=1 Tax=Panagrellus redivivus TaxID=6233 RepID=A0A7E4VSJ4_PANRE
MLTDNRENSVTTIMLHPEVIGQRLISAGWPLLLYTRVDGMRVFPRERILELIFLSQPCEAVAGDPCFSSN